MRKKKTVLLCSCNYTCKGVEGLIRETYLSNAFELTASADNLKQGALLLGELPTVDVVILVLNLGDYNLAPLLTLLGESLPYLHPGSKIVLMGDVAYTEMLKRCLNGLKNDWVFLDSSISLNELQERLLDIGFTDDSELRNSEKSSKTLSSREFLVLRKLLNGENPIKIAGDLQINQKTVSHHKRAALIKLGVRSLCPLVNMNVNSR